MNEHSTLNRLKSSHKYIYIKGIHQHFSFPANVLTFCTDASDACKDAVRMDAHSRFCPLDKIR